jgi:lysozyme
MTTPIWTIKVGDRPTVIDLSDNNAGLTTEAEFTALYAAGVREVIHKLTEGIGHVDPLYAKRMPLARAAGMAWGAYHFCTSDAIAAQQAFYLKTIGSGPILSLSRIALDAEPNRGATIQPAQAALFSVAMDKVLGFQAYRYGNSSVLEYKIEGWHDGPLWWAKYGPEPTVELFKSLGLDPNNLKLWQETGSGHIAGHGPVDLSYARPAV